MVWNTGCRVIANGLDFPINIVDLEDDHFALSIPSREVKDFNSVIFPWCNSRWEVEHKAFRVSSMVTGKVGLYLFQEFATNKICWSPSDKPWDVKKVLRNGSQSGDELEPRSNIDVYILPDRVWGVPAQNNNNVAKQVLDESLNIIGAITSIAALFI